MKKFMSSMVAVVALGLLMIGNAEAKGGKGGHSSRGSTSRSMNRAPQHNVKKHHSGKRDGHDKYSKVRDKGRKHFDKKYRGKGWEKKYRGERRGFEGKKFAKWHKHKWNHRRYRDWERSEGRGRGEVDGGDEDDEADDDD